MRKQLLAVAACLMFSLVTPAFADGPLPPSLRSAGVTQEQWDALQTEVRRAAARANVSERALASVAERLGLALATRGGRVDVSDILSELEQLATRIGELEASLAAISRQEDPAIAALVAQARNAIAEGDLDAADAALADARRARAARNAQLQTQLNAGRLEESAIAAAQADVAGLRRDYIRAAALFEEAAALAPDDSRERFLHTMSSGHGYYWASFDADTPSERVEFLRQAVARYDRALAMPRVTPPSTWARAQLLLAQALASLIEFREPGAPERTAAAYEALLEIQTRDAGPVGWAQAQRGLAFALWAQDTQSPGGNLAALRRAASAYEAALTVTDPHDSLSPFAARISLGDILMRLDEHGEAAALERAIASYEEALRAYHLRTVLPRHWSDTQMKLGHALRRMGLRLRGADGVGYLEYATAAYDAALELRVRDADPAAWTDTVYHLALTYRDLGDMRGARAMARNALSGAEQAGDAVLVERARALIAELPAP